VVDPPANGGLCCAQRLKVLAQDHPIALLKMFFAGPKHVWEINASLNVEKPLGVSTATPFLAAYFQGHIKRRITLLCEPLWVNKSFAFGQSNSHFGILGE
jgi:hypothetical protein